MCDFFREILTVRTASRLIMRLELQSERNVIHD